MRRKNPESIWYAQVAVVVEELYTKDYGCVIRTPRFSGNDVHASTVVRRLGAEEIVMYLVKHLYST